MSTEEQLTNDEIALYDRQIRLWGMATQLRLRSAKILIINLGGVGTEVVKNLVLGGINSIEILDDSVVKEEDYATQFFLPDDESVVGQLKLPLVIDRIKELNSLVELTTNTSSLVKIFDDPKYFQTFNLIVATELDKSTIEKLNGITRSFNIPLYVAGVHGMFGYIFTDLIKHVSVSEKDAGNQLKEANTKITRTKTITEVSYDEKTNKEKITVLDEFIPISEIWKSNKLPTLLNKRQMKRLSPAVPLTFALFDIKKPDDVEQDVDKQILAEQGQRVCTELGIPTTVISEDYLEVFSRQAFTEYAPVTAIIGGALAQDIIQFLSKKESPINNVLILDSTKSEMPIYAL
ncbi:uncharacterized protein RJT20DRAFT_146908 [Scheffersomyces xylosifermentans]|uniref:uncharacterized protein n=1 Tax=Scheffersomyces xylosifermentans TaxID=1304137 RepID=UPI00315CD8D9